MPGLIFACLISYIGFGSKQSFLALQSGTKYTTINHLCTSFSFQTLALNCSPQNRDCFPQKSPQCEARPPCQLSF